MKPTQTKTSQATEDMTLLADKIRKWGLELGFADVGFSDIDLTAYEARYFNWIGENFHGEMDYMKKHGTKRTRPNELVPGTTSIISLRMNYLDTQSQDPTHILHQSENGYISRYALGKDYHKLIRKRLQTLAQKISETTENFHYRAFADSAPVLERAIAEKAGLGFTGKNSLTIHPRAGSWFFLGEIYCNLPFVPDQPEHKQGCGPCNACLVECPTHAIIDNAVVDSRRCISYLTIEYKGSIPLEFREAMGNRIYGCDDCQLVCPWNKFTTGTNESGFKSNDELTSPHLLDLWGWREEAFLTKLQGSPIRRIGYAQWKRNLAIAIGNIKSDRPTTLQALHLLRSNKGEVSELVDEHIDWAVQQLEKRLTQKHRTQPISEPTANQPKNTVKPNVAFKYYLPKELR